MSDTAALDTEGLVTAASPIIGRLGGAFYFTPETRARGKELGLDGLRFYFLGRGGVLGDVEAPVIISAFGYFSPGIVTKMWNTAREVLAPRQAAREYLACAYDLARGRLEGAPGLDEWCKAAETVVGAAEPAALALFAGYLGEALPEDGPARVMQLMILLRELRGGAHLVAVRAAGVAPEVAHFLRRPNDMAAFGWDENAPPTVTDADRKNLADADALTDRLVAPAYDALDGAGRTAFLDGLEVIKELFPPPRSKG